MAGYLKGINDRKKNHPNNRLSFVGFLHFKIYIVCSMLIKLFTLCPLKEQPPKKNTYAKKSIYFTQQDLVIG